MCKKGNVILGTLRVLIIIICEIHMLLGGLFITEWIVIEVEAMEHISNLTLATSILAIGIGIFGIVAASKRNLWLVGIFAVCKLISMSLYSALAAHIAKILHQLPDDLIEAQFQDDGLNTTSTTYKPYEDDDYYAYPIYYIIAVTLALVEVLTILASLSYFYIVRRQKESSSGDYRF